MKTFIIQIGSYNSQNTYKIKAKTEKTAKALAKKHHVALGRSLNGTKTYTVLAY